MAKKKVKKVGKKGGVKKKKVGVKKMSSKSLTKSGGKNIKKKHQKS